MRLHDLCAEADGAPEGMDIDAPEQAEGSAPAENGILAGSAVPTNCTFMRLARLAVLLELAMVAKR